MKKTLCFAFVLLVFCQKGEMWAAVSDSSFSYIPVFKGVIKGKYEHSLNSNEGRFNIRNARVSVQGKVHSWIDYLLQIDLNDEGNFKILDADVKFRPIHGLVLAIGQTSIPFSCQYIISPTQNLFVNRALLGKYLSGSSRDMGVSASYRYDFMYFPLELTLGIYNGAGTNFPQWDKRMAYSARLMLGSLDHYRVSFKTYSGKDKNEVSNTFYAIDFHYINKGWTVQAEGQHSRFEKEGVKKELGAYVQSAYCFPLRNAFVKYIEPAGRWDGRGLLSQPSLFDVHRMTMGVNFGFHPKYRKIECRINYEKYFIASAQLPLYFEVGDKAYHDKVSLEFLININ